MTIRLVLFKPYLKLTCSNYQKLSMISWEEL
uniref:Uncharacterized protein n=1 Tax=Arundo donax TaxID=35708 RepID=A0A0A9EQB6_ARUDO